MKAMKAEDAKAVMDVVDVPFFWDGVEIINDREALRRGFEVVFADYYLDII